jgi:hypothetical protein
MSTLLVLGSKPEPMLPPASTFDAVACANASGASARRLGLPWPTFTVMSSIVASGKTPSNVLALAALAGLRTQTLFVYPRPPFKGSRLKWILHGATSLRTTPWFLKRKLREVGYDYDTIVLRPLAAYVQTVRRLCGNDPAVGSLIERKVPSTGVVAIALGLADPRFERVVISGFSFQITHAYADNPDIAARGSVESRHAATDTAVIGAIARQNRRLWTMEPVVHERTGVPLLAA